MFGRHSPRDGDAVAAAQRRLEALAAQFHPGSRIDADPAVERPPDPKVEPDDGDEETTTSTFTTPDPVLDQSASATPRKGGRHAARVNPAKEFGRWDITTHHVTLVALTVALLIAVTAWWVLRAKPEAGTVSSERTLPSPASAPAGTTPSVNPPTAGEPAATLSAATMSPSAIGGSVVVDVAGKVRRPGIVELPAGSRIVDALDSAGGVRPDVDTASLNLARVLVDGEQIVVGLEVPAMPPTAAALGGSPSPQAPAMVDLNTATAEQLDTLPGIGPVTAAAILTWRAENGAFSAVDELLEVSGIGDATLADIQAHVYV